MKNRDTVFDDVLRNIPPETLDLLGGRVFEVGHQDGVLLDLSRNRQIWYRVRFPTDFEGRAAVILFSQGGMGSSEGHTWYAHFGTAFARLGFLSINIGHMESANEVQHRYDRALDISYVIDALARTAAASEGTPYDAEEAFPLPSDFTGVPEEEWLGNRIRGQQMPQTPLGFTAVPDINHIGVAGHSFGAYTAHAVGGAEHGLTMGIRNFRDPRVDAIVAIAPPFNDRYGYFDKGPTNNSWKDIAIPSYVLHGDMDLSQRLRTFECYKPTGDKYLTVGKGQTHNGIAGEGATATVEVKRFLDLNTALFFHTYLRGGDGRCSIGTLEPPEGWSLERKLDPSFGKEPTGNE